MMVWAWIRRSFSVARAWITPNVQSFRASREPAVWTLSLIIGLVVSIAAIAFRQLINVTQWFWFSAEAESLATALAATPWYWVLFGPAVGGLLVGFILTRYLPSRRTGGVADVIEAKAYGGRNIELKPGLWSAVASGLSLGFGGSAGREGPMVHLGAAIATSCAVQFYLPDWGRKTLLACGVASAVSASFNAPIAGVLFAHEVVLNHYAKRSFIPIVISSVMGTVLSRIWFGDAAAFEIPDHQITSFLEIPAFALLGVVCAVVAVLFQLALIGTDAVARTIPMPLWIRPATGGLMIGAIALIYPQVLGVGYEATDNALKSQLPIALLIGLVVAKTAATAITLASRFGGGVVSPSLYIGAMTGSAFGLIAAQVFPELASSQGIYAILGMGAVAAAVIGAPISTTVMVFELTGGYALSIALLLTVSVAVGINQAVHGRSIFQWQLELRGLSFQDGPHRFMVRSTLVASFMDPLQDGDSNMRLSDDDRPSLRADATLETALRTFDESGHGRLPVVSARDETIIVGHATQVAALRVFNKALVDMSVEEHR
ncbi:MAG: chloride channel protein [Pseudomonadota bacterium]